MINRASMVSGFKTRALNLKAFSGGSGLLTWASPGNAVASKTADSNLAAHALAGRGLGNDPVEVGG